MVGTLEDPGVLSWSECKISSTFQRGGPGCSLFPSQFSVAGLIPRAVEAIFAKIPSYLKENQGSTCNVVVSFFEIYNDRLFDLLDPRDKKCNVFTDSSNKILVQGIDEKSIKTSSEFLNLFHKASAYRSTAATNLNKDSSRSHAILIIKITTISAGTLPSARKTTVAKLHLVDLAGSEDNRVTGNAGQRLTESSAINTSLSAVRQNQ
jgi:kinesin family member 22